MCLESLCISHEIYINKTVEQTSHDICKGLLTRDLFVPLILIFYMFKHVLKAIDFNYLLLIEHNIY